MSKAEERKKENSEKREERKRKRRKHEKGMVFVSRENGGEKGKERVQGGNLASSDSRRVV